MKDLVAKIAKSLVDRPDEVRVRQVDGSQASVIELQVTREDLGKVIGKQGRTAAAMRTIIGAAAMKKNMRTIIEILD